MKARHSGLFSRNEIKKRNQHKHKANGLCVSCSQKAKKGHTYCEKHLESQRKANKKFREKK